MVSCALEWPFKELRTLPFRQDRVSEFCETKRPHAEPDASCPLSVHNSLLPPRRTAIPESFTGKHAVLCNLLDVSPARIPLLLLIERDVVSKLLTLRFNMDHSPQCLGLWNPLL